MKVTFNTTSRSIQADANRATINWILEQNVSDWRVITFTYPYWNNVSTLQSAVSETLKEFKHTFLRNGRERLNDENGALDIRHLIVIGGDQSSGTRYHAHGLIDGLNADDAFLIQKAHKAWVNCASRATRKLSNGQFYPEKATFYHKRLDQDLLYYLKYITRWEGDDLSFGTEKIDFLSSYLAPSKKCANSRH